MVNIYIIMLKSRQMITDQSDVQFLISINLNAGILLAHFNKLGHRPPRTRYKFPRRFSASPFHEEVVNAENRRLMTPAVVRFLG